MLQVVIPEATLYDSGGDLKRYTETTFNDENLRQWANDHVVTARDMIDVLGHTIIKGEQ